MELLKCFNNNNKIRIGRDCDGGYVIADGFDYDVLISCGISDDDSFEHAFLEKNSNIICYAYDERVYNLPNKNDKIKFFRKHICSKVSNKEENLYQLINNYKKIFLKMDIEGGEFEWFNNIPSNLLSNISQMVIEFHHPFKIEKFNVFKKINQTHYLIHFHPNNCYQPKNINGIKVPKIFECTYINKNLISKPELNKEPIPSILDRKNVKNLDDIKLVGYPYTF